MMILSCISYLLCSQKIVKICIKKQTMSNVDSDDCLTWIAIIHTQIYLENTNWICAMSLFV
jgi:hypothetical protein